MPIKDERHARLLRDFKEYVLAKYVKSNPITEEHFNYYGDRGDIDLVYSEKDGTLHLADVKPQILDVGYTIRQLKKGLEYYPKYKNLDKRNVKAELVLTSNVKNYEVFKNLLLPLLENEIRDGRIRILFFDQEAKRVVREVPFSGAGKLVRKFLEDDLQLTSDAVEILAIEIETKGNQFLEKVIAHSKSINTFLVNGNLVRKLAEEFK